MVDGGLFIAQVLGCMVSLVSGLGVAFQRKEVERALKKRELAIVTFFSAFRGTFLGWGLGVGGWGFG